MDLNKLRVEIDSIDAQIADLFERRMNVSKNVALAKIEKSMPVFDRDRENQVIMSRTMLLENPELKPYFEDFLHAMMDISKAYQTKYIPKIEIENSFPKGVCAYQGTLGAYGEEAVYGFFGKNAQTFPCENFEDVVNSVVLGKTTYGVLPIENSSAGSVDKAYDVLKNCYVVGEYTLEVKHVLASPGTIEEITNVFSHEQGFLQCEKYLEKHGSWLKTPYFNTAIAAKFVSDCGDAKNAVIASAHAAKTYRLNVHDTKINDNEQNFTRFIVLAANPAQGKDRGRGFISIVLSHEKGSLLTALKCFADLGYNLTHIKSRPIPNRPFTYKFYVEFEGDSQSQAIAVLLESLAQYGTPTLLGRF